MAKLIIFAATFVALLAVTVAFDFSCLFPDLKIIDKSKEQQPRCQKQIQKQQLDCCQTYLRDSSKFPQTPMVVDQASSWREAFPRCCEQLERITKQCRCEAITQVVRQQMQMGRLEGIEMQEMLQNAQSLPILCRIKKAQQCNIPMASF